MEELIARQELEEIYALYRGRNLTKIGESAFVDGHLEKMRIQCSGRLVGKVANFYLGRLRSGL